MISGGIEVNSLKICFVLKVTFGDDPLVQMNSTLSQNATFALHLMHLFLVSQKTNSKC